MQVFFIGLFPCPTAFGSLYGDRTFKPTAPIPLVIDFTFAGPSELTVVADPATDTITVVNAGDYEITYDIQLINQNSGGTANTTFTIQRGGPLFTDIPESNAELVSDDFISAIGRTVQVSLNAGEQIRLAIIGSDWNHQYYLPALTVKRIDC
ncbi:hypothetical protein QNH48_24090 [Neobacillus sp. YX16]|uniref:hypothetical protein n=1 Tax=Neobacillus sp. YX16 TaxID=3047874 RepID=UPI0024C40ECE|nr:hypothetical protein [Neobacillus sp. YX16]WHZ02026.1 hypothetical protein QNH48_24090 [Neobacillus sp. YX16]